MLRGTLLYLPAHSPWKGRLISRAHERKRFLTGTLTRNFRFTFFFSSLRYHAVVVSYSSVRSRSNSAKLFQFIQHCSNFFALMYLDLRHFDLLLVAAVANRTFWSCMFRFAKANDDLRSVLFSVCPAHSIRCAALVTSQAHCLSLSHGKIARTSAKLYLLEHFWLYIFSCNFKSVSCTSIFSSLLAAFSGLDKAWLMMCQPTRNLARNEAGVITRELSRCQYRMCTHSATR